MCSLPTGRGRHDSAMKWGLKRWVLTWFEWNEGLSVKFSNMCVCVYVLRHSYTLSLHDYSVPAAPDKPGKANACTHLPLAPSGISDILNVGKKRIYKCRQHFVSLRQQPVEDFVSAWTESFLSPSAGQQWWVCVSRLVLADLCTLISGMQSAGVPCSPGHVTYGLQSAAPH